MRKVLLSLMLCCMAVVAFAGKEDSYVLYEGFENGEIPATWMQENVVGSQSWIVEAASPSSYPAGVAKGNYCAALRNTTSQTQHYATRLVTPVFNIETVIHPVLIFSHAQVSRSGDVDTLRVLYREAPDKRWVTLKEYNKKISSWKNDTIYLPAQTALYQIAFEGVDNFGRGIVIDEVIVRPEPTCEDPTNIMVGAGTETATITWTGSLDTDSFHVVIADKEITDILNPQGVVVDAYVADYEYVAIGLKKSVTYYVYLQAMCGGETSAWVGSKFTTKTTAEVPYTQTFNMNYASGTVNHVDGWSYGTSIRKDDGTMEYMPFVNQNTTTTTLKNYSFSSTTCLVFSGARAIATAIPAGEYVYGATPEFVVDKISDVQLTFWGTTYTYFGDDYAGGIIVGVMTDASDFSTFEPVDTIYATEARGFGRYTVYFDNYTGEGKFIAFASNFSDKKNIFFVDDIEVTLKAAAPAISDITLRNLNPTDFDMFANFNGASQVEYILAKDSLVNGQVMVDPAKLAQSYILAQQTVSTAAGKINIAVPAKAPRMLQLYVRSVNGENKGAWALPVRIHLPMLWTGINELFIDFEEDEPCGTWAATQSTNFGYVSATAIYPNSIITQPMNFGSTAPSWPACLGTTYGYNSKKALYLGKELQENSDSTLRYKQIYGDYVALPYVEKVDELLLKFYLKGYSATSLNCSRVAVGVMSDPFDPTTFDTVAVFESPENKYIPCVAAFLDYKGTGHYPAIMAVEAPVRYKYSSTSGSGYAYTTYKTSYQYLDAITMSPMSECVLPTGLAATNVSDTTATLSWNANGMSKWEVIVSTTEDFKDIVMHDETTVPSYEIKGGLKTHTVYYYKVNAICEGDVKMESIVEKFKTICYVDGEKIPYIEDFENYTGGSSNQELPACWFTQLQKYTYSGGSETSTSYYPYIYTASTSAHAGTKCFYFYYTSSTSGVTPTDLNKKVPYFALPEMAEDLNKLQISFWMKAGGSAYVGDTVYVGVLEDMNDITTFDTIAQIQSTLNYTEYIIRLENYTGKGKYLAMAKTKREYARSVYIDDIRVDYLSNCEKVQGVNASSMTTNGATLSWNKAEAAKYEVVIATLDTTLGANVAVDTVNIVSVDTVATNSIVITSCPETNTIYYAYVRALCDETNKGDWSNAINFRTTCVPGSAEESSVDFTDKDYLITCWTVGVQEGTTVAPSKNTNGYLYMFNSTTSDGAYAIMPPIDIDSISRLQMTIFAHGGNGAAYLRKLTVGVITNPSDLSTFTPVETIDLPMVSGTTAAYNYGFDEATYQTIRFDQYFGDWMGRMGTQVMFLSESGDKANYIYIRSIKFDTIPECKEPIHVKAIETNTYDATIAWENVADQYEVKVVDAKNNVVFNQVVAKDTVQITGLEMLTKYTVQVRTICGAGDTSMWSNPVKFQTECPAKFPLPYEENFDNYASGAANHPNCWDNFSNSTTAYPYVYSSAKKDGANGLYMYRTTSYYSYAVLPVFDAKCKDLMLSLDYRNANTSYPGEMYIGIATDVTSVEGIDSTIVMLDTLKAEKYAAPNNVWYHYSRSFDYYAGEEGQLVFISPKAASSTTAGYMYLDNVYVEKTPTCFRPIDPKQTGATANSLTFTWTPSGNETAWDVVCVAHEAEIDETKIVTVTEKEATFQGLTASTNYDMYVRANCGEGDVSDWSAVLTANTLYKIAADEAQWTWDDDRDKTMSFVGTSTSTSYRNYSSWISGNTYYPSAKESSYSYSPYTYPTTIPTSATAAIYGYHSESSLRVYATSTYKTAYAILPEIVCDLDTMQIRFMGTAANISNRSTGAMTTTYAKGTYPHAIKVGVLSNPMDFSSVEYVDEIVFPEVTAANISEFKDPETGVIDTFAYWNEYTVSLYGAKGKNIVFYADYNASYTYAYIDNVVVEKETGCNRPTMFQAVDSLLGGYDATLSWKSRATMFEVEVFDDANKSIKKATIPVCEFKVDGLAPTKTYSATVRAICGEGDTSALAKTTFTTPCVPLTMEQAKWDFSSADYSYTGSGTTLVIPTCWEAGQLTMGGTSTTYMPKVVKNTTAYQYGRNQGNKTNFDAVQLYNYSTTYGDSYLIMPELNVDMDETALHFWIRAAYFYQAEHTTASYRNRLCAANNNYQKNLKIGVVADPTDPTTFEELDVVTYPYSWSSTTNILDKNDPTGNYYWYECIVPLKKYKDKGQIVFYYPKGTATGYMYIDDVEIIAADFCTNPVSVKVENIAARSADITWSILGKDSVRFQLSTKADFSTKVVDKTLTNIANELGEAVYHATGLTPGLDYYARVKHLCGPDDESDWAETGLFVTDYAVRFTEKFVEVRTYPADWSRATAKLTDVLDNGATLPVATETAVGWTRGPVDADIYASTGTGAGTSSSSTYYNYWLITPIIDLSEQKAEDKVMLSFDARLTTNTNSLPYNDPAKNDKLAVVVSTDGGATYTRANATIWGFDETDQHDYSEIGAKAKTLLVDLNKYIGQHVKIAFVASSFTELNVPSSKNYIHIDNVQVNTYAEREYSASICEWEDYEDENFSIAAEDMFPGVTTLYEKYTQATGTKSDSYIKMSLTVNPEDKNYVNDAICYGQDYTKDNFNIIGATASAVYKQKLTGVNSCDSTVILTLTVNPKIENKLEVTICQGDYYEFAGEKYYTSTVKSATFTSTVTGCDSTVTLYLTVNAILSGTDSAHICQGEYYEFGKYGKLTEPGVYVDTLKTALGCDSIATLNLFVHEPAASEIRALIKKGSSYNDGTFAGLTQPGDYPSQQQTIWGCDSIVTLHLMVADESLTVTDSIALEDLPYVLRVNNGTTDLELLSVGTEEGVYTRTVILEGGVECKVIIVVGNPVTGLFNTEDTSDELKVLIDGHLYIRRSGVWYNALGTKISQE